MFFAAVAVAPTWYCSHINIVQTAKNVIVGIGKVLADNEKLLANAVDLVIRAGGVGLKYKTYYPAAYFGFLGQPNAQGFGVGSFAHVF